MIEVLQDEDIKVPEVQSEITVSTVVRTLEEFNAASDELSKLKDSLKTVEADEKSITAPINDSLKKIRGKYKPMKELLERNITVLRNALNIYKRAEDAKREADRLALEELAKDGASMADLVSLVDEAPMLGGRLTTTVEADPDKMSVEYKLDLLARVWEAAMVVVRKDVAAGRVETGVTVSKEKRI